MNYKKVIVILIPIIIFLVGAVFFYNPVFASDTEIHNVNLLKNEIVDHDYFAAGNTVTLSGTVNGDAYIAGGNVMVDGVINGDLITAGGNITILGEIEGDVRAAGGNVIFSSNVGKNATLLGGSISMSDAGSVKGSLVSAGGNISVNSPIGKGVNIATSQLNLGNTIGGDVNAYVRMMNLSPSAKISGNLNYWSEKELLLNNQASISGTTNYHFVKSPKNNQDIAKVTPKENKIFGLVTLGTLFFNIYKFLVAFILGLLLLKLLPIFTSETVITLERHPWASIGIGFLTVILLPILFIILLITILGIPLGMVLLMAIILISFIAEIITALFVGSKVLKYFKNDKSSQIWNLFIGLVILGIISVIPVINVLVGIFTYLLGTGALLIQKKNSYILLRQKNLI